MSRGRFSPARGALSITLVLASACATAGDGDLSALDSLEAGTGDDGSGSDSASHFDSSSGHDSSPGVDATPGVDSGTDSTTALDSSVVDSTTPDTSVVDTGTPDSAPDASGPCSQTCTMGCCDSQGVCHSAPFTDQYCPTANAPGTVCEDCASQGYTCFLDIFFYVCL